MPTPQIILLLLIPLAYLLGSIPFGLIVGLAKGVDPRKAGSGNIGATNVGRLLGGRYFALVFVLDLLKGMLPVVAVAVAFRNHPMEARDYALWLAVGLSAILGHMFSIFLGFEGGKGVATSAGVMLGLYPYFTIPGLIAIGAFIVLFMFTRYVSVGSIGAAILFPIAYMIVGHVRGWGVFGDQLPLLAFAIVIPVLIVFKHRGNIARLMAGTENRFVRRSILG